MKDYIVRFETEDPICVLLLTGFLHRIDAEEAEIHPGDELELTFQSACSEDQIYEWLHVWKLDLDKCHVMEV